MDAIYGGAGNDVMDAGAGSASAWQYLYGQAGDDTYLYSKDNQLVYLSSAAETATGGTADRVRFTDLSLKDLTLSNYLYTGASAAEGNALNFTWSEGASTGQLRIALGAQHIERFEFADGTTLSAISYNAANGYAALTGTAGNDTITAGAGKEFVYGGAGNDVLDAGAWPGWQYLYGQAGDDTYVYAKQSSYVMLLGSAESATSGTDRVVLKDLTLADLTFATYDYGDGTGTGAHGNTLRMLWNDGTSSGELRIAQLGAYIERFEFADGTTLSAIQHHAATGQVSLIGTSSNDFIHGGASNDLIYGGAGNDVIDAGGGTSAQYQYLYGSIGDDTYVYSKENVYVYIGSAAEGAATGTVDRVKFTDLSLKDLTLSNYLYTGASAAEGNALNFTWDSGASTGQLRIALGAQHIERFEFADGTTLSAISYDTASGATTLTGTAGNDLIRAGNGYDAIYGGTGNDVMDAGAGATAYFQYLYGQAGDDTYVYSKENVYVYIGSPPRAPPPERRTGSSSPICR